jgi:replicative DNA helicase
MTDDEPAAPIHHADAERSVVGAMLLGGAATVHDVLGVMPTSALFNPRLQIIADACEHLAAAGDPVDLVTVATHLGSELVRAGGPAVLAELITEVPTVANAAYYARIVVEDAALRRVDEAGRRMQQLARHHDADAGDIVERARTEIEAAIHVRHEAPLLGSGFDRLMDDLESDRPVGLMWPYMDVGHHALPFAPGTLTVFAARPGKGKSIMCGDVARTTAQLGHRVHIASLEMDAATVLTRQVAAIARVSLSHLLRRELTEDDWRRMAKAQDEIRALPITIDDAERQSVATIRATCLKARPELLVVDYLTLMQHERADRWDIALGNTAKGLRQIGRQLGIPVILAAQLNRGAVGKKPKLEDLKDSGDIEAHADTVVMLDEVDDRPGEIDLWCVKQRNGPVGWCVALAKQGHYSRLVDMGTML